MNENDILANSIVEVYSNSLNPPQEPTEEHFRECVMMIFQFDMWRPPEGWSPELQ